MNNNNTFYTNIEIKEALRIKDSAMLKFYNEYPPILIEKFMEIILKKSK